MDSGILRKDEESSSASPDTLRQAFRPLVFGSLDDRLLDALPGGIYFCDRDGALIRWNRRAVEFWGREPKPGDCNERFCGSYKIYRLDGSFVAHADCPMAEALRTGQPQRNIEGMVERPDGTRRIAIINIEIIQGDDGHLLGAVNIFHDITEQKQSAEALRKSEQGFRQLANAMPQIVWTAGSDGQIDYLNHRWTEFTGLPQTASNDAWAPLLHPSDAAGASARWAEALKTGQPFDMEVRLLDRRDGCYRWHLIRTVAARDEAGHVTRWFGTSTDIHEQKKAEESLRFLAQASAALAGLVDYERTLQKIANLAVPYFADWAAVDVQSEGRVRRIAVAHQDPQKLELAQELMRHYPPDLSAQGGIGAVFRTGEPEILSEITDDMLAAGAKDELHLTLLRSLALTSYICVPLAVGGEILGVLTFATAESKRRYSEDDLAMAKDLGRRAAIAIDNTRLYQTLQEADRKKDEFLATLAHELRNPLAPIHNSLQILRLPHIDSEIGRTDAGHAGTSGAAPGPAGGRSARRLSRDARKNRVAQGTSRDRDRRRSGIGNGSTADHAQTTSLQRASNLGSDARSRRSRSTHPGVRQFADKCR
jgi:PAS domain S-box-containing protein